MSPETLLCLLVCLWPCSVLCQQGSLCLGSREEGDSFFIISNPNLLASHIMGFQKKLNDEFENVSTCYVQGPCEDFMPLRYSSRSNVTEEGYLIMFLNIFQATISDNLFRIFVDSVVQIHDVCIEMFVRPAKPACDPPTLLRSGTQISTTCKTEKVYPGALIEANMYQAAPTDGFQADVECETSPSLTYPGYNATKCTARFPLSGVKPGTYMFYFAMYPKISNVTEALGVKVESDPIGSVVLTAPEVKLSRDCPTSNYIVSGMCTCELTTQGNPPAQAKWYTQTGQELLVGTETLEDGSSKLNVTYHPSDPTPTFECRADTALDVSPPSTVSFSPLFAYGPNSITIEAPNDGKFDLCPSEERLTKVTCKMPADDVKPGVRMTITVNGDAVVEKQEGKIFGNQYIQEYSFRPPSGGNYAVICRAENSISSQLSMSKSLTLKVREPPTSSPVFVIPGNDPGSNVSTVILGKTIDITCKVDGGQPRVSEVTIICGSRRQQVPDNIGALTLEVTPSLDGQPCYCTATHDSGCYDKVSEVLLKVEVGSSDNSDQATSIIIGLSLTAVAAVIVVTVIAFIFFYKKRTDKTPGVTENTLPSVTVISHHVPQLNPDNSSDGYITVIDPYDFILDDGTIPTDSAGYCRPVVRVSDDYVSLQ